MTLVDAWAGVWRGSKKGGAQAVLAAARRRDEEVPCLAGLLRSTYADKETYDRPGGGAVSVEVATEVEALGAPPPAPPPVNQFTRRA